MIKVLIPLLLVLAAYAWVRREDKSRLLMQLQNSVPLTDPAITRILERMASLLDRQKFSVVMLDDQSIESSALEDGRIALSRGLVMLKMRGVLTAEELAAVVAEVLGRQHAGLYQRRFWDFLVEESSLPRVPLGPLPALTLATNWATRMFFATRIAERRRRAVFDADAWASALLMGSGIGVDVQISALAKLDALAPSSQDESLAEKLAPLPSTAERIAVIRSRSVA